MKIGLALSGGGIRGIAHAGVIKAFEENNIKVDIIGGTSSGGIIASLYAMGYSANDIFEIFKTYAKEIVNINSIPFLTKIGGFIGKKKAKFIGNADSLNKIVAEAQKVVLKKWPEYEQKLQAKRVKQEQKRITKTDEIEQNFQNKYGFMFENKENKQKNKAKTSEERS